MRQATGKASLSGSPNRASRNAVNQKATTPPHGNMQRNMKASTDDQLTSPKSDAGVRYSSYSNSLSADKAPERHSSSQGRSASSSLQQSSSMQQHSSTVNGMYETPKQPLTRKTRFPASGSSRDREAALRQKARMRRRSGQGRHGPSGPIGSPEEGRPPRSSLEKIMSSPRSGVRKQNLEERRQS